MPIEAFAHYNLRADRALLDELCTFYREIVGLTLGNRPPLRSHGYWLYAGGKDILHLSEARQGEVRQTNVAGTFDHVAFACSGRAAIETRLLEKHVDFTTNQVPSTGQVQLFFKDPAGNGVELNFADSDA